MQHLVEQGRKFLRLLFIFLSLLSIVGCGPGFSDHAVSLGGGYYYVSNDSLDKTILKDGKFVVGNLVFDHWSNDRYVVAIRLVGRNLYCKKDDRYTKSLTDAVEYWIIDKNTGKNRYTSVQEVYLKNLSALGIESPDFDLGNKNVYLAMYEDLGRKNYIESNDCIEVVDKGFMNSSRME